jgi:hypothetical protein
LWDVETGQEIVAIPLTGSTFGFCFSPDGGRVATVDSNGPVQIRDAATGQELCQIRGHVKGTRMACFSPDGRRLATVGNDEAVRVWDVATGQEVLALRGGTHRVRFSPDGKRLAAASGWEIRVWDASEIRSKPGQQEQNKPVQKVDVKASEVATPASMAQRQASEPPPKPTEEIVVVQAKRLRTISQLGLPGQASVSVTAKPGKVLLYITLEVRQAARGRRGVNPDAVTVEDNGKTAFPAVGVSLNQTPGERDTLDVLFRQEGVLGGRLWLSGSARTIINNTNLEAIIERKRQDNKVELTFDIQKGAPVFSLLVPVNNRARGLVLRGLSEFPIALPDVDESKTPRAAKREGGDQPVQPPNGKQPDVPRNVKKPDAKDMALPSEAGQKDPELEAAQKLRLAKLLAKEGLTEKAAASYQEILRAFPNTKAAAEARELLDARAK